jgi:uncharacterized protein (TIGR02996 family)
VTKEQELLKAVIANPQDDLVRLAYADSVATWDLDRAAFIRRQVEEASRDRAKRDVLARHPGKDPLLREHEHEWTRTIAKYAHEWQFDRGFITEITIDPFLFLEYGEWLLVNAPIRAVQFLGVGDDVFPMNQLVASPLLARLDIIRFLPRNVSDEDLLKLTESSHARGIVEICASRKYVPMSVYEAFGSAPATRGVLSLYLSEEGFPGERFGDTGEVDFHGASIYGWMPMSPEGAALEKKYGYIPWLHPRENACHPFDAAYFVANGTLPVTKPGSRVG